MLSCPILLGAWYDIPGTRGVQVLYPASVKMKRCLSIADICYVTQYQVVTTCNITLNKFHHGEQIILLRTRHEPSRLLLSVPVLATLPFRPRPQNIRRVCSLGREFGKDAGQFRTVTLRAWLVRSSLVCQYHVPE